MLKPRQREGGHPVNGFGVNPGRLGPKQLGKLTAGRKSGHTPSFCSARFRRIPEPSARSPELKPSARSPDQGQKRATKASRHDCMRADCREIGEAAACQFGKLARQAEMPFSTKPNDSNDLRNIFNQWHGGCYKGPNIAVDCQSCAERPVRPERCQVGVGGDLGGEDSIF